MDPASEQPKGKRNRARERLSALDVTNFLKKPKGERSQLLHDGAGLWLIRDKRGGVSWVFKYRADGKARTLGLGAWPDCDLAKARTKHSAERTLLKIDHVDPLEHKAETATAKRLAKAKAMTFKQAAKAWLASKRDGWRSKKTTLQPESILERFAYPVIGDLPVSAIDVGLVMRVLEQEVTGEGDKAVRLWIGRRDTARKLRGHLEAVLGWAGAQQLRSAENPARWDVLKHLLPAPTNLKKVKPVEHHTALPYIEAKVFMDALKVQGGTGARALELTILTATRTSETLGATWGEIDAAGKVWTIPTERTKTAEEHCVPLSEAALTLLATLKPKDAKPTDLVFPGAKPGRPLSNMAMAMMLRRMKRDELTVHGFRSSFRDWGAEKTTYARELLEKALGHVVGDETERAYQRGPMLERRRAVMKAWAEWCEHGPPKGDNVTDFEQARGAA